MQQSQRAYANPALEHAIRLADELDQGVIVGLGLMADYPEANRRHFAFMLEGLAETAEALHDRGIKLVAQKGAPDHVALALGKYASAVVCDRGYLRHQRQWRRHVAAKAKKQVIQVEGDTVMPVEAVSDNLHFGQISPVEITRKIIAAKNGTEEDKQAFLEELIVRRELAINFVYFESEYDAYDCLPSWAKKTLDAHRDDERPWKEWPVFGKVRYMSQDGLKRKFDMDAYIQRIDVFEKEEKS